LSEKDIKELLASMGIERYEIIKNKLGLFTLDFVIIWDDLESRLTPNHGEKAAALYSVGSPV